MYSLETRSLTDKYDILVNRDAEASARAAGPSSIWNGLLSRATSEASGVHPEHWLPAGAQNSVKSEERNVVRVREAGSEENVQATLVQRTPTPCSLSESLRNA